MKCLSCENHQKSKEYNLALRKFISRSASVFLSELKLLLDERKNTIHKEGKEWIALTINQWAHNLLYSKRQIERIIKELREKNLIYVGKFSPDRTDATNFYTLNIGKIEEIIRNNTPDQQSVKIVH